MNRLFDTTVVVICHNQNNEMIESLASILEISEISDILVVDNYSSDETPDTIVTLGTNYIQLDEGKEGYGKIINIIRDNIPLKKYVLFLNPGYCLEKQSLLAMIDTLDMEDTGVCGPLYSNSGGLPQELLRSIPGNEALFSDALAVGGYVWMVKSETLLTNAPFNEELLSPNRALLDYGFMLLNKGIRPRICERAVAASTVNMLVPKEEDERDRAVLLKLYNMTYFNCAGNYNICDQIKRDKTEVFNVLEVGCDLGATLLEIKRRYPKAEVKGIELNHDAAKIAGMLLDVREGNIEKLEIPFSEKFDYIIFGDVLEHLHNTEDVVEFCKGILNPEGYILANIPNLMHISVMSSLIRGRFPYSDTGLLDRTHVHFFTYFEIREMFERCGFSVEKIIGMKTPTTPEEDKIIDTLVSLSPEVDRAMYDSFQYLVRAKRGLE